MRGPEIKGYLGIKCGRYVQVLLIIPEIDRLLYNYGEGKLRC